MAVHRKVDRFRMEPTRAQAEALLWMAGARRFVWNWGLARRKEVYAATDGLAQRSGIANSCNRP